ncbi:hypothetical protein [Arthrobacter sp. lap29]|uniref:hypothetical protein n=1 Tax=Arthrobacter sp. lap29 TaxID=3056122 RepID=UPI0028F6D454|nr:hypothetical protein [Arthrobacter sp. lap29]
MSVNEALIEQIVTESLELVIYSDDHEFNVLPVNEKIAEKAFLSSQGRVMNEDEQTELKAAFQARAAKDKDWLDNQAVESCDLHMALIMTGTTLTEGVENFSDTVEAEVKEAMRAKGISCAYKLESHLPAVTKLRIWIDAAQEMEA